MKKISLTIAGSDCSGGAGIQADIKSMSANNCFAMSVITLITAQNSYSINNISLLDSKLISDQIDQLFTDYNIESVKIGALGDKRIIEIIIKKLKQYNFKNIVLDPVMISKTGKKLLDNNSIESLKELMKLCDIITPNILEAENLLNVEGININNMKEYALELLQYSKNYVLLKGGHLKDSKIIDILVNKDGKAWIIKNNKIFTNNTHGTGCTLSSAISANLANNQEVELAVKNAIVYVNETIINNINIGKGCGPLDHFYNI